ncbi:MAG: DUF4982 domain-containing protein, partial [Verrucomicrobia bacterium]|nr:DUF4982 domain-containing protein [Verrucomicrobiota bacterium]
MENNPTAICRGNNPSRMKNPRQNSPKTAFALVAIIIAGLISIPAPARAAGRQTLNFNPDWKFIRSDPTNAQAPGFDDRNWTAVSTPHTYNDTDTFDNFNLPGLRGETNQWGGRTWYRKTFTAPKSWRGKKVYIEFDAVRQVAEVYLNGHCLGACKNGFLPFGFDLTPGLNIGTTNVLAVMCDNTFMFNPMPPKGAKKNNGPEGIKALARRLARLNALIPDKVSQLTAGEIPWNNPQWHPAMGGIYRDVKLIVTDPLHVSLPLYDFLKTEGPYIYATNISVKSAVLNVQVPVENDGPSQLRADLSVQILDHHGINVLSLTPMPAHDNTLFPGAHSMFAASAILQNPRLWEQDYPYLYRARIVLKSDGKIADVCDIPFGIRAVHWSVKTGFWINGHHVKLHGWGQKPMDEWPGLGDAMPDWMQFYTIQLMKQAGGNWIRWGHCAAGPAQIQSSDELGLGVEQPGVDGEHDTIKAAWTVRARAFRDDIIFYRNDPSILVWEAGNQKVTPAHAAQLRGYFEKYDPFGGRALAFRRADKITAHYMDVSVGTEGSHEAPRLPVIEGEYDREESPRRVWDAFSPPNTNYAALQKGQSYNLNSEQFAVNEIKNYVDKLGAPNHCGGANWIFSDSTSGGRNTTEVDRASGEVDAVRLPKQAYYVCQAMWLNRPAVHIIGHWTYPPGTVKNVYVASNCRRVQLLLNGKSLGFGSRSDTYLFTFTNVLFQPGLL